MTDEVQQAAADAAAQQMPAQLLTVEDVEAKRYADNLDRAKANGYVDPSTPTISERVAALIDGVQHAMANNAPMSREHFAEMRELLGVRGTWRPDSDEAAKAE